MTTIRGISFVQLTTRTHAVAIEGWGEPAGKSTLGAHREKPHLESATMVATFPCDEAWFHSDNPWLILYKEGKVIDMFNINDVIRVHYVYEPTTPQDKVY